MNTFKKKENNSGIQEKESSEIKTDKRKTKLLWAAFVFTLVIVLTSLVSVVFPALIVSNYSTIAELENLGISLPEVDPFTTGVWTVPFLVTNAIIFCILILYFKKKLPNQIKASFDFVLSFEVSKKIAIISISVLLAIYVAASADELTTEEEWEDYPGVKKRLERWSPEQTIERFEPHVRYFFLWSSMILFGHYTVIPFIASISLLLLTYFFTVEITKKRFAGIIALIVLLQSNLFLTYDSTVSYTNFWTLLYLLSLFLIYKAWLLSPISYFLSIAISERGTLSLSMPNKVPSSAVIRRRLSWRTPATISM